MVNTIWLNPISNISHFIFYVQKICPGADCKSNFAKAILVPNAGVNLLAKIHDKAKWQNANFLIFILRKVQHWISLAVKFSWGTNKKKDRGQYNLSGQFRCPTSLFCQMKIASWDCQELAISKHGCFAHQVHSLNWLDIHLREAIN